jgi:uncharacterized protein YlzI (FlbEa/FlbD family)
MAKFVNLSGYYFGYHKKNQSRFINIDHIEYVEPSSENPNQTFLIFDPQKILVIEKPVDEVMLQLIREKKH